MRQLRLLDAHQRFMSEHARINRANDGLIRHPKRAERAIEDRIHASADADAEPPAAKLFDVVTPARAIRPTLTARPTTDVSSSNGTGLIRYRNAPYSTASAALLDAGRTGHQHHRQIQIVLPDGAQQLQSGDVCIGYH